MAGIAGMVGFSDTQLLHKMCDVLRHRGPDCQDFYTDDRVALGVNSMKTSDLQEAQLVHNEDSSVWLIIDGEIHNSTSLQTSLEGDGHKFYTRNGTEVIVHLYEEFGEQLVEKLEGVFSFAVWDKRLEKLFLVRDRLGMKPLFYTRLGDALFFGSEIKSLLQYDGIKRELDLRALHDFLTFLCVPAPKTIFKGIRTLPPGYSLGYCKGVVNTDQYWDLSFSGTEQFSEADVCRHLIKLLTESVRSRLKCDKPSGAFLSGGVDSSIIVGLMTEEMDLPVKTFSIGFEGKQDDELEYAAAVARWFGTDHHEFVLGPDAIRMLPKLLWYLDQPFADASAIPTFFAAKLAKRFVSVVLTGDGGDESFAGYKKAMDPVDRLARVYRMLPSYLRTKVVSTVLGKPEVLGGQRILDKLKTFGFWANLAEQERFAIRSYNMRQPVSFTHDEKLRLYSVSLMEKYEHKNSYDLLYYYFRKADAKDFPSKTLYVDIKTLFPNDWAVKVDRMTMAVSLMARSPFTDHRFMQFAARLPYTMKLRGSTSKYILKKAFCCLLPKSVIHRKKMGFGIPMTYWLDQRECFGVVSQILLDSTTRRRGLFDPGYIQKILRLHRSGKLALGYRIWALLTFELWHRIYLDSDSIRITPLEWSHLV